MQKKDSIAIVALIVCVLLMLSASAFFLYVEENKKHAMRQRATFDIIIDDVASLSTIERMEYLICGEKTPIEPYEDEDGSVLWIEKISTPKQLLTPEGAPCPVEILITQEGKTKRYPADQPFTCPDCDGSHYYEIIGDKAVYTYWP